MKSDVLPRSVKGPGSFRPDYPFAPGRFALGRFTPILNLRWMWLWVEVGRFAPMLTLHLIWSIRPDFKFALDVVMNMGIY